MCNLVTKGFFRTSAKFASPVGVVSVIAAMSAWEAAPAVAQTAVQLPDVTVTTFSNKPERRDQIAGTVQVIDRETIERSTAKSLTDLFAENAVGFLSEWSAGQTSLNIRGAATEGQGRDYRSQVLILINGHRAGTANISKLSTADVERIEIVRGPSSIVYGSQNMGGVVNIIMKTGRTAPGTLLEGSGGSWDFAGGKAQTGGVAGPFDYYVGSAGSARSNYRVGGGREERNTDFSRAGATGSFGWQINELNRIDVNVRTDGIYDEGFRGSGANYFAYDTRTNRSYDVNYEGRTANGRVSWFFQNYGVTDIDDLTNPSPLFSSGTRTSTDRNTRRINIVGTRFQPRVQMWDGNELLLGTDWERSWIRSDRFVAGLNGLAAVQVAPQDNNQTEKVNSFYVEDTQKLIDDRLVVRGGVRKTYGETSLDPTQNVPLLKPSTTPYEALTYSTGATMRVTDWMSTRVGLSSGFRAPTATELGLNFVTNPIGTVTFGNPNVRPESSRQIEFGTTFNAGGVRLDLALFQNNIFNRIQAVRRAGSATISDTINNPGAILVKGLEVQAEADMLRIMAVNHDRWRWSLFSNGYYNFDMTDQGANVAVAKTDKATRINQYEVSVGTRFGQSGSGDPWRNWNVQVLGLLRGPMYYNTEERLLDPAQAASGGTSTLVYRKDAFWVANMRGEVEVAKGVKLFAAINNIFDINEHPIFIALDQSPCLANAAQQNGGCGTSMPGREFIVGMQARF